MDEMNIKIAWVFQFLLNIADVDVKTMTQERKGEILSALIINLLLGWVKAVDSQREISVFAVDANVVPGQVIQTQSTRGGHLRYAGSQVDAHLQRGRLKNNQTIIGTSGSQEKKSVRSWRPEPET